LRKPLRPLWVTQESSIPIFTPSFPDFHPIVLCTASRRVRGGEVSEGGYIQGAADDHEAWANGLTPDIFWKNKKVLLSTNEQDLPEVVNALINTMTSTETIPVLVKPTTLHIAENQNTNIKEFDAVISCGNSFFTLPAQHKNRLHLKCRDGKLGSRDLRNELSLLPNFMESLTTSPVKLLICGAKDHAVGVALSVLCLYASDNGLISNSPSGVRITKSFIRQRLTWLTTANPNFNPSRETLKSVNSFLMPDPSQGSNPSSTPKTSAPNLSTPSLVVQTFRSLGEQQTWALHRKLTSAIPTHPSGTVTGTAKFTPCATGSPDYASAYLYEEEGEFVTDNGLRFNARRRYVYRLKKTEDGDEMSIYFFDDEKRKAEEGIGEQGEGIGGLFVEMGKLEFESTWSGTMRARNKETHLCIDDLYAASWRFGAAMFDKGGVSEDGGDGKWWEVQYDVKGPKKDYVSWTRYSLS
jgi:tRNA A64-2'-O-ribosylphosphate transferase